MRKSQLNLEKIGKYSKLNEAQMCTVTGGLVAEPSTDTSKKDVDSKQEDSQSGDGKEAARSRIVI